MRKDPSRSWSHNHRSTRRNEIAAAIVSHVGVAALVVFLFYSCTGGF